jgi:hypothetical protein
MPRARKLAVAFQTSMTRCWAAPIENTRAEQVWRALQRAEQFYMYGTGGDGPGTVMFSLQDRDFDSEAQFREFAARVRTVVDRANDSPCRIEMAYYPAGSLAPRFHLADEEG